MYFEMSIYRRRIPTLKFQSTGIEYHATLECTCTLKFQSIGIEYHATLSVHVHWNFNLLASNTNSWVYMYLEILIYWHWIPTLIVFTTHWNWAPASKKQLWIYTHIKILKTAELCRQQLQLALCSYCETHHYYLHCHVLHFFPFPIGVTWGSLRKQCRNTVVVGVWLEILHSSIKL